MRARVCCVSCAMLAGTAGRQTFALVFCSRVDSFYTAVTYMQVKTIADLGTSISGRPEGRKERSARSSRAMQFLAFCCVDARPARVFELILHSGDLLSPIVFGSRGSPCLQGPCSQLVHVRRVPYLTRTGGPEPPRPLADTRKPASPPPRDRFPSTRPAAPRRSYLSYSSSWRGRSHPPTYSAGERRSPYRCPAESRAQQSSQTWSR